jgi:hypothetical protein
MATHALAHGLVYPASECPQELYGGLYTEKNVALSGTHTHAGPAGYLQYVVYDITSLGFIPQTFDALVDGVVLVRRDSVSKMNHYPRFD